MVSTALIRWQTSRSAALDRLILARETALIANSDPALPNELTHVLITRLAAEFQGFCRDLHDEATNIFVENSHIKPNLVEIYKTALVSKRLLEYGNANWRNIGSDFVRIGFPVGVVEFASQLSRKPSHTLGELIAARNAIVHSDQTKIDSLNPPAEFSTFTQWRAEVDQLAVVLDYELIQYLAKTVAISNWNEDRQ